MSASARCPVDDLLEDVDVGSAGEHLALGAPDERAGVGALELVEAVVERLETPSAPNRFSGGSWSTIDGDGAVALQPHRVRSRHRLLIRSAIAAISSVSAPRGIHGSFSGSSS